MRPALQRRVQRYGWDKAAEYYEASWKEQLKPAQDTMMKLAALKPGENILETACGTGLVTFRAAKAVEPGGELFSTDISDAMLELAESRAKAEGIDNVTFRRMDAEELDLDGKQFDAALCGLGLMYIPDPVKALRQMNNSLVAGGRAVAAVWGERKNCGWADIFPIVDKRVASDVCPLFFQQGTGNTLELSFRNAGFEDIHVERIPASLHYPDSETAVMAAFAGGPVALAYRKFDDKTRQEAHQEYLDSISSFRREQGYQIPGEFVVTKGVKAASAG